MSTRRCLASSPTAPRPASSASRCSGRLAPGSRRGRPACRTCRSPSRRACVTAGHLAHERTRTLALKKTSPLVPTPEQARIEQSSAPRILIEANAGVGKTATLCLRALRLVDGGVDPARIVMLAYSEPGAEAIVRSFERLGATATLRRRIRVGTFEDFCAARLAR